jgi:hypothetical protein
MEKHNSVNGSLGIEEKPNHVSRIVRRKQERLQNELGLLHDRFRNSFINFLMGDCITDDSINEQIKQYDAKWRTFCTVKGVGGNVPSILKGSLDNIYKVYKEKLNQ